MLKSFFNHASMHPVQTALYGGALILAAPFLAPWIAPILGTAAVAPAASIGHILGLTGVVGGGAHMAVNATRNIGPMFNNASQNGGKIALGGLGLGMAAPHAAPLLGALGLGSLSGPVLAFATAAAPWMLIVGAGLFAAKMASPIFSPKAPHPAAP